MRKVAVAVVGFVVGIAALGLTNGLLLGLTGLSLFPEQWGGPAALVCGVAGAVRQVRRYNRLTAERAAEATE